MKKYIVTYTEELETMETIQAINEDSAMSLAKMIAFKTKREVKAIAETIDMNKFLCKE